VRRTARCPAYGGPLLPSFPLRPPAPFAIIARSRGSRQPSPPRRGSGGLSCGSAPRRPRLMRINHHRPLVRRNFGLGIVNGVLFTAASAFIEPTAVLPAFVLALTGGGKIWVGIVAALITAGWYWPEVLLIPFFSTRARLLPFYWISAVGRIASILAIALVVGLAPSGRGPGLFSAVAGLFFVYASCGAVGMIPFYSIVTDSMPANRRGRFFGVRCLIGGALAMGAGVVVKAVLGERYGLHFPQNYVLLFAIATVLMAVSALAFSLVKEPPRNLPRHKLTLPMEVARGRRLLRRDRNWRLLMWSRVFGAIAAGSSGPFLVPFALERLGAPTSVVGAFLTIMAAASAGSNLLWSWVGDRLGNRKLLIWSAAAAVLPAAIALVALAVPPVPLGTWFGLPMTLQLAVFSLAFIPLGSAGPGQDIGQTNFLLDIAPEQRRSTYLGFSYLLMLPLACWPVAGALVIGGSRFGLGFGVATAAAAAMLLTVTRLGEPRAGDLGLLPTDEPAAHCHPLAAGGD
jgi:Major Facilitator Superfamily